MGVCFAMCPHVISRYRSKIHSTAANLPQSQADFAGNSLDLRRIISACRSKSARANNSIFALMSVR